jgi:hypothetical protein
MLNSVAKRPSRPTTLLFCLALLLGCPADSTTPPPEPAEPTTAAATPEPSTPPAEPDPRGHFTLVPDQLTSYVVVSIETADGPVEGRVTKVFGGVYLVEGQLHGADGTLNADLSSIETNNETLNAAIREILFPGAGASAIAEISEIVLEPLVLEVGGTTTGTAKMNLGMPRGPHALTLALKVERPDAETWVVTTDPFSIELKPETYSAESPEFIEAAGFASFPTTVSLQAEIVLKARRAD